MKKQNKLRTYLTLTTGAGCISAANAQVVIYSVNSANDTNPNPSGISIGAYFGDYYSINVSGSSDVFAARSGFTYFTSGTDLSISSGGYFAYYAQYQSLRNGASLGDQNYANLSFDGNNNVYEAVAQFNLDGSGGGYLIAIATNADGSSLSISDGKALIDNIPEPSSLALLALGATGLLTRRQRKLSA